MRAGNGEGRRAGSQEIRNAKTAHEVAPFLRASGIAPIFVAVDLEAAIERYTKLGFVAAGYRDTPTSPPVYAFVCFGPGEFHIASVNHVDPKTTTSACYLWVEDADAVHASWAAADVEGRLHAPRDTSYGMREMAYVDPDGNLVRVGSPMHPDP